jgi:hypothetical protein
LFFHYCPDGSRDSLESTIYLAASEISLGSDLQNLALVMGLLKDMVRVESSTYTSLNNANYEGSESVRPEHKVF